MLPLPLVDILPLLRGDGHRVGPYLAMNVPRGDRDDGPRGEELQELRRRPTAHA